MKSPITKQGLNSRCEPAMILGCTCIHLVSDHMSFGCGGDEGFCPCTGQMRVTGSVRETDTVVDCTCSHSVRDHHPKGCFGDVSTCPCKGSRQLIRPPAHIGYVPMSEMVGLSHYGSAAFGLQGCSCGHLALAHGEDGCMNVTNDFACPCTGKLVEEVQPKALPAPKEDDGECGCVCETMREASVCTCECHQVAPKVEAQRDSQALMVLQTQAERDKAAREGKQILGSM